MPYQLPIRASFHVTFLHVPPHHPAPQLQKSTYLLDIPHAALGVDIVGQDAHHLLARLGHDDDRAAVEVELGGVVVALWLRVEESAFFFVCLIWFSIHSCLVLISQGTLLSLPPYLLRSVAAGDNTIK